MALYRPDLGTAIHREATTEAVWAAIRGKRRDFRGRMFEASLLLTLLLALAVLVTLLVSLISTGWEVFATRKADFLTSGLSSVASRAGVWQGLMGSLMLMVFVVVLAFPIGIGAAVYLEEYASDNAATRFMTANIRNLAGVPSIVYGLLGLAIFVLVAKPLTGGLSVISGGLTLAILALPIVIITSMEALRAVPSSIREAGYSVGATKWEVIRSHVLPYASPGIFTGTVLSMARALGETAPLILVGAVTGFFFVSAGGLVDRLQGPYTTLPTVVFAWSRLPGEDFRQMAAAASLLLMGLILVVNGTAILLRNRYERKW